MLLLLELFEFRLAEATVTDCVECEAATEVILGVAEPVLVVITDGEEVSRCPEPSTSDEEARCSVFGKIVWCSPALIACTFKFVFDCVPPALPIGIVSTPKNKVIRNK